MKKILFIIEHLNAGGAERSLVDILTNLDYSKYTVDLLLVQGTGDYEKEIPDKVNIILYSLEKAFGRFTTVLKNSIKNQDSFSFWFRIIYHICSLTKWSNLKYTKKLFKNVNKEYDCIVACRQSFICNELAAYVFHSKKKISWWHHGELDMTPDGITRLKQSYSFIDTIVAVSESSAEILKNGLNISQEKIIVIPNMLCISRIKQQAQAFIPESVPGVLNIVSVGRFSAEKNMQLCPKIGYQLMQKGIDFMWYLIGDGDEESLLKKIVSELHLEKHFCFTGRLNNPYPYVKNADLFVHTSLVESQGIAILESMALKTPVIVVESKGPSEYIKSGYNGYLVDNDAESIAELISEINDNQELLAQLSARGYETVKSFSPESTMTLVDRVLS